MARQPACALLLREEFVNASYATRRPPLQELVRENFYTASCLLLPEHSAAKTGHLISP